MIIYLDQLHKLLCRAVSPAFAASLEPLADCGNVASFINNVLEDDHPKWSDYFIFLILVGCVLVILLGGTIFVSPFVDVKRNTLTIFLFVQLDLELFANRMLF